MTAKKTKDLPDQVNSKPTPPDVLPDPDFGGGNGLGPGIALVLYAVTQRDGATSVTGPFAKCATYRCVASTLMQMPSAEFAGLLFWLIIMVSSTVALGWYLKSKLK